MNIGWAIQAVREGRAVRRKAWRPRISISLVRPRAASPLADAPSPVLEMSDGGRRVPVVLPTADLLATDWVYA